ncbi:glycosyltransferase family 2 protein [Oceanicola sp. S124]|uniref:glycosyltransferase family 2 protein n=1 Tax=Oceanicola sp. S124 TaxID=1042378 RepID=UPI000255892F|nr:glycosyltransferase family 2 protein [Oceanicola sp. S124]
MVSWSQAETAPPPAAKAAGGVRPARLSAGLDRAELWLVGLSVGLSATLFLIFSGFAVDALYRHGWPMLPFVSLIGGLFYCALCYQVIRLGAARRPRATALTDCDPALLRSDAPSVTVLIPSYQESRRVVIETVLSAALARYRNKRIVVLVDDSPGNDTALAETMGAIAEVQDWLAEGRRIRDAALAAPATSAPWGPAYGALADWLDGIARKLADEGDASFAHVDSFVVSRVVEDLARRFRGEARRLLRTSACDPQRENDLMACLLTGGIESFQRKRFANLSHGPNKAMNLNAYLGLMGSDWDVETRDDGQYLVPATTSSAELTIPQTDYVLTLDADSVIMADYMLTLVGELEDRPDAAVAQTPYLTFPGGPSPVERIAGATTDIQYLIHQGSSHYDAAYWVGANAVIRTRALQDICQLRQENGHQVKVYVQDKTVIEDTGSTIDLQDRGWHVHNHFAPMAYSATPADFGALAIQRKRWANGGLILFFDLLCSTWKRGGMLRALPMLLVRSHYLLSPLIGNVGILALMLMAVDQPHPLFWAPLFMTPYFVLYMLDLRRMGYQWWDLFGVCALNLMLLPVNLAGILASIWQMAGGKRHSFTRTPKLASRSFIPPYAFLFNLAILALMTFYVAIGLHTEKTLGVAIPLINIVLYSYGLIRFVGLRDGFADLGLRMAQIVRAALPWLFRPSAPITTTSPAPALASPLPRSSAGHAGAGLTSAGRLYPRDFPAQIAPASPRPLSSEEDR